MSNSSDVIPDTYERGWMEAVIRHAEERHKSLPDWLRTQVEFEVDRYFPLPHTEEV